MGIDPSGYMPVMERQGRLVTVPRPKPKPPEPDYEDDGFEWNQRMWERQRAREEFLKKKEEDAKIDNLIGYTHQETVSALDADGNVIQITVAVTDENQLCSQATSWNTGSLQEAIDIFNRFKERGYKEGSYALEMLYQTLFSKAVGKSSTEELMAQFAVQFTGTDTEETKTKIYDEIDRIKTGEELQLKYDKAGGGNLDRFHDCSGFVSELYEEFFNYDLLDEGADYQAYKLSKSKDASKQFVAGKYEEEDLKIGDLIYMIKHGENDYADHVVMYIGNGLTVEEADYGVETVVREFDNTYMSGYVRASGP